MANIFDYLNWRGDLTFSQSPLNEVDNLILSRLSYIPFEGILHSDFNKGVTIKEAVGTFLDEKEKEEILRINSILQRADIDLLEALRDSNRFCDLEIFGYKNHIDYHIQKQFSAMTIKIQNNTYFIAYRGTDDTLVGWKEDFNMSFLPMVPAQNDAVTYLEEVANTLDGDFFLGGHSKGGNLAVYASVFCADDVKNCILGIFSNDGPGFAGSVLEDSRYLQMKPYIKTYVPQSSVVGMLMEHTEDYIIIKSTQRGIFQHDVYTWEVLGKGFVGVDNVTPSSVFINSTLKEWLYKMDNEERENFINNLYDIFNPKNAKNIHEMTEEGFIKNIGDMLGAYQNINKEIKDTISKGFSDLFASVRKNFHLLYPEDNKLLK